jgi:hypothetical protein
MRRFLSGVLAAGLVALLLDAGCSASKPGDAAGTSDSGAVDATLAPEAAPPPDAGLADAAAPYPLNQVCAPPDAGTDAAENATVDAALDAADADPDAGEGGADAGPDGGDSGLDSGVDSGVDAGFDPCERCSLDLCCNTHAAVFGTEDGAELAVCMDACWAKTAQIAPCQAQCFGRFPGTAQVFRDQSACTKHRCPACGTSDDRCYKCFRAACGREELACDLDADCFLVAACAEDCGYTEACMKSCADAHPKAKPLLAAIDACTSERCAHECSP